MTMNFFNWDEHGNEALESGTGTCRGSFNLNLGTALQGFIPTRDAHIFGTDFKLLCEPGLMPPPLLAILNKLFNLDFPSFAGNGNVTMNYGQNATVNWFGPVINIRRGMVVKKESDDCPLTGPIMQAITAASAMAQKQHVHRAHPPHEHPAHAAHGHELPGDSLVEFSRHGAQALLPTALKPTPAEAEWAARVNLSNAREAAERAHETVTKLQAERAAATTPELQHALDEKLASAKEQATLADEAVANAREHTAAGNAATLKKTIEEAARKAHDLHQQMDAETQEYNEALQEQKELEEQAKNAGPGLQDALKEQAKEAKEKADALAKKVEETKDRLKVAESQHKQAEADEKHAADTAVGKSGKLRNEADEKKKHWEELEHAATKAEEEVAKAGTPTAKRKRSKEAKEAKEEADRAKAEYEHAEAEAKKAEDDARPEDVKKREKAEKERKEKVEKADKKAQDTAKEAQEARETAKRLQERANESLAEQKKHQQDAEAADREAAEAQERANEAAPTSREGFLQEDQRARDARARADEARHAADEAKKNFDERQKHANEAHQDADTKEHAANDAAEEANHTHREAAVASAKDKATGWIPPNLTSAAQKAADEAIAVVNTLLGYLLCAVAFTTDVAIKSVYQGNAPNFPDEKWRESGKSHSESAGSGSPPPTAAQLNEMQTLYDVTSKSLVPALSQIIMDLEQIGLFLDQVIGWAKDLIELVASFMAGAASWRTWLVRAELAAKLVLDGFFVAQQIIGYKQTIQELIEGVGDLHKSNLGARFDNVASSHAGG